MDIGRIFMVFMGFAALFGFYQTYHWDIVTNVVVIGAMVAGATAMMDLMLYPKTRLRIEHQKTIGYVFLGAVSVVAYLAFADGRSDFRHAKHPIGHYAALWCSLYPYCCAALVALDRIFNVFGGRRSKKVDTRARKDDVDWRKVYEEKFGPYRDEEEEPSQTEAVIKFDPKRFH